MKTTNTRESERCIGRGKAGRKGREIERSREEKRRMRKRMIKREREGGILGEVKREGERERRK